MTLRSKLFATVALPVLSVSMIAEPALAASNRAGQQAEWLVAQALEGDLDGDGQLSPEEQQLLQQQKQQQAPAEEPQAQPEEQPAPAEEPQPQPEEQAPAEEPQPQPEEQAPAEEPQAQPEEQAPAEEPQAQPEEQAPAEEPQAQPEEQAPAEEPQAQPEEQAPAEEPQAQPEEQAPAEEPQAQPEEQTAPAEEPQAEPKAQAPAEEPPAEPQAQPEQPAPDQPAAEQPSTEQPSAEQPAPEQPAGEQPSTDQPAAQQPSGEQPATEQPSTEQPAGEQPAAEQPAPDQPAADQTGAQPETGKADQPVPVIEDTLSPEQKQQIAEDPAKTADTVVLPVDNGAAVLDSDKDADTTGGADARETRTKEREQIEVAPPPQTDADAQAAMPTIEPAVMNEALQEQGKKVSEAPQFQVPGVTNITNNNVTNNNVTNNTVVNNVTNNTVVNNVTQVNQVNQVNVVEHIDNSVVLNVGNQIVVRTDDRERLRMDSNESYYENLSRGRSRETIIRPDGTRIVTIYNRYGDVIQRSRIRDDGDEYVMIYAPEADSEEPRRIYDAGYDLPPMRLTVPVSDYIVSTSRAPDEDYYSFLEKPPVEKVERVYTIDEVRYSARLRDKVRRIDLDTITFATGSAEVPMSQAKTLKKVASAMLKVLKKDPGETFLIEGHTDAVGSDKSNLVLSDRRASSVAALLTEVYGIPPENLVTQGYGERYLKIRTAGPEQQNRRVTIRRVTPLVRPMAKK